MSYRGSGGKDSRSYHPAARFNKTSLLPWIQNEGSAALRRSDRAEGSGQPIQDLADDVVQTRDVSAVDQHQVLLIGRRAEQVEQWTLQRLDRSGEVLPAGNHQRRHAHARREIDRFDLGIH